MSGHFYSTDSSLCPNPFFSPVFSSVSFYRAYSPATPLLGPIISITLFQYPTHPCFLVFSSYLNSKQTQLSIISVPALQEPSTAGESHRIEQINVSYHSTIFTHLKWTLNIAHQSSWSIHSFSISLPTMTISNALQTFSSSYISSLSTDNAELQLYRENCIVELGTTTFTFSCQIYLYPQDPLISSLSQSLHRALGLITPYLQLVRRLTTNVPSFLLYVQQPSVYSLQHFNTQTWSSLYHI